MIPLAVRTCGNCGTHFKGDDAKCPKCNPTSLSVVVYEPPQEPQP